MTHDTSIVLRRMVSGAAMLLVLVLGTAHCSGGSTPSTGSSGTDGGTSSSGTTSSSDACVYKDPGTQFASCESDSDCFSGYCKETCKPGPCCQNPTTSAINAGRGYTCKTEKDCESVRPDFISRGGSVSCRYDSLNGVSNGCVFLCPGGP